MPKKFCALKTNGEEMGKFSSYQTTDNLEEFKSNDNFWSPKHCWHSSYKRNLNRFKVLVNGAPDVAQFMCIWSCYPPKRSFYPQLNHPKSRFYLFKWDVAHLDISEMTTYHIHLVLQFFMLKMSSNGVRVDKCWWFVLKNDLIEEDNDDNIREQVMVEYIHSNKKVSLHFLASQYIHHHDERWGKFYVSFHQHWLEAISSHAKMALSFQLRYSVPLVLTCPPLKKENSAVQHVKLGVLFKLIGKRLNMNKSNGNIDTREVDKKGENQRNDNHGWDNGVDERVEMSLHHKQTKCQTKNKCLNRNHKTMERYFKN